MKCMIFYGYLVWVKTEDPGSCHVSILTIYVPYFDPYSRGILDTSWPKIHMENPRWIDDCPSYKPPFLGGFPACHV